MKQINFRGCAYFTPDVEDVDSAEDLANDPKYVESLYQPRIESLHILKVLEADVEHLGSEIGVTCIFEGTINDDKVGDLEKSGIQILVG